MEILYYALFAISVAATFAQPINQMQEIQKKPSEKRLTKREAAIFVIDSLPAESVINSKPKKVYRRISKSRRHAHRHGPKLHDNIQNNPQTKFRTKRIKSMFAEPFTNKVYAKTSPKYYVKGKLPAKKMPGGKKPAKRLPRPPIPEFPHQLPPRKPSPVERWPVSYWEPTTANLFNDPPVDSYGAPLKTTVIEPNLQNTDSDNYDVHEPETGPDYGDWHAQSSSDSKFAISNNFQTIASPSMFEKHHNFDDDFYKNSYVSSKYNDNMASKNRHQHFKTMKISMNKPWMRLKMKEEQDQILVGGQYAEPPGRYVPMSHPSDKVVFDNSERFSSGDVANFMEVDTSATVSPYVNYKNSNMAFSPQNLNDAFSLVM